MSTTITQRISVAFLAFVLLLALSSASSAGESKADTDEQRQGQKRYPSDRTGPTKNTNPQECDSSDNACGVRIVTEEELSTKNGEDGGKELWLSIFGKVYDVSNGPKYYAPKSGYHIFAGRDGTVPFVTGNFTDEECSKHTDELTAAELYALYRDWASFYEKEEKYPFVGLLCCRFYDSQGKPTEETRRVWERARSYEKIKAAKDKERREKRKMMMTTTMAGTKTISGSNTNDETKT